MDSLGQLEHFYKGYFKNYHMPQSLKAMNLALKYHTGQRKGGGAEVTHQFEIVNLLIQLLHGHSTQEKLDCMVAASFMHDVVEDYPEQYSSNDLCKDFDEMVCKIVKAVTKKPDYDKYSEADHNKYYAQVIQIPEAVIMKIGDRIQNIQSIEGLKLERQKEYVVEVEDYFFPMLKKARRLYPDYINLFSALGEILRRQIKFVKRIHELEDQILKLKEAQSS